MIPPGLPMQPLGIHSYSKFQHVGIIRTTKMKGYIPTQKNKTQKTEADGSPCPFKLCVMSLETILFEIELFLYKE